MIAVFVLLALAATAQVQAFPGSEPVAKTVAVLSQNTEVLGASLYDNIFCLMGYLTKVQALIESGKEELKPVEKSVEDLYSSVKACRTNAICILQAIRDGWEGSEDVREAVEEISKQAMELAEKIKADCFKSSARQIFY